MKTTIRTLLFTSFFVFILIAAGVAIVQSADEGAPPSSPRTPLPYSDAWRAIEPGAYHWYTFKYRQADHNQPMQIRFYTRSSSAIKLLLLNGDQVRVWQQGGKLEAFGEATPALGSVKEQVSQAEFCAEHPDADECLTGDLDGNSGEVNEDDCASNNGDDGDDDNCFLIDVLEPLGYGQWAGTIGVSGEYYLLVRRASSDTGPGAYRFTVGGDGFSFR